MSSICRILSHVLCRVALQVLQQHNMGWYDALVGWNLTRVQWRGLQLLSTRVRGYLWQAISWVAWSLSKGPLCWC